MSALRTMRPILRWIVLAFCSASGTAHADFKADILNRQPVDTAVVNAMRARETVDAIVLAAKTLNIDWNLLVMALFDNHVDEDTSRRP